MFTIYFASRLIRRLKYTAWRSFVLMAHCISHRSTTFSLGFMPKRDSTRDVSRQRRVAVPGVEQCSWGSRQPITVCSLPFPPVPHLSARHFRLLHLLLHERVDVRRVGRFRSESRIRARRIITLSTVSVQHFESIVEMKVEFTDRCQWTATAKPVPRKWPQMNSRRKQRATFVLNRIQRWLPHRAALQSTFRQNQWQIEALLLSRTWSLHKLPDCQLILQQQWLSMRLRLVIQQHRYSHAVSQHNEETLIAFTISFLTAPAGPISMPLHWSNLLMYESIQYSLLKQI